MTPRYFLGADVGGTKTHVLIADEDGRALGFGESGPGNHDMVGYAGLTQAVCAATMRALQQAGLQAEAVAAAGWGIAGYDWPAQLPAHHEALKSLGLRGPYEVVNDAIVGLLAGAEAGWGIGLVAGTGCNCWGIDSQRRFGRVVGLGRQVGEAAGAAELVQQAINAIAREWTRRGPATGLTPAFIQLVGAHSAMDLLEGLTLGRYSVDAEAAPLVFRVAAEGDAVAQACVRWAGQELAGLALSVIAQLQLERQAFDVVLIGGLFEGGAMLIEPLQAAIHSAAPGARLVRLNVPPVIGGVLLARQQLGLEARGVRERLIVTTTELLGQQPATVV